MIGLKLDDKNSKETLVFFIYWQKYSARWFFWIFILQEVLNKIRDKSITHNIFRIQDNESIKYGFSCIALVENMLPGKTLLNFHQMTIKRTTK